MSHLSFTLASSKASVTPRLPLVIAFSSSFPENGGGEALKAELRGSGADLVVLTPTRGFWLSPDGDVRELESNAHIWMEHGVTPTVRGGAPLTVLVYDERLHLRLRKQADAPVPVEATLLLAIREARKNSRGLSRRDLLASTLVAALALALAEACAAVKPHEQLPAPPPETTAKGGQLVDLTLVVNGERHALQLEPRVSLLDALRENLKLTGTKKGCDLGQCGACTVLVDGVRINSCLQLAVTHEEHEITTIEGLQKGEVLHPMQQAFIDCDGLQCGYCTPGQILSAIGLLREGRTENDAQIREGMSGNLCRCGAYPNILAAIKQVQAHS